MKSRFWHISWQVSSRSSRDLQPLPPHFHHVGRSRRSAGGRTTLFQDTQGAKDRQVHRINLELEEKLFWSFILFVRCQSFEAIIVRLRGIISVMQRNVRWHKLISKVMEWLKLQSATDIKITWWDLDLRNKVLSYEITNFLK